MSRIAVITHYPRFVHYIETIQRNCPNDEILVYLGENESSIPNLLTKAENDGCTAIITGAFTYNLIASRTSLPIIDVEASFSDVISAWSEIKSKGINPKRTVIFLKEGNPILMENNLINKLSTVFGSEVIIKLFCGKDDYEEQIKQLGPDIDMVIAGEHSIDVCKSLNIPNEFLQIGLNTMNLGVQEAIRISNTILNEQIKNARLNAILNSSEDGIIYINRKNEIEIINPFAIKLLHLDFLDEITFESIISKLNIFNKDTLFSEGLFINEEICNTINEEQLIVSTTSLEVGDDVEGIILFLRETDRIREMEQKIRVDLKSKGNFAKYKLSDIIGNSPQINECKRLAKRFGMFNGNVFIYGETGTGKELFAHAIHNLSMRSDGPFYAINCAAIPENILESELFGYSEGSFTGAKKSGKAGIFELAHGGTLFLDEIAEMDISCQSKLLRAIQEKEIRRIGDDKIIPIDVRIIAASNRNLHTEVEEGRFREDLLYRINVMNLVIPPLRERPSDIKALINNFIHEYSNKYNILANFKFSEGAMKYIENYLWKGNIRELRNFSERIFVYGYTDGLITETIVKKLLININNPNSKSVSLEDTTLKKNNNSSKLSVVEKKMIEDAIEKFGGNKTKAAEALGVSRTYIWRHLKDNKQ